MTQDMTEKLIQDMNCMNSTTYRFLKAHVEKLFLSRRKKISYVWAQIFQNLTGEQTPCELANLFPHWEKNIPSLGKKYSLTGNNNEVAKGHSLCALFLRTFIIMVMMVTGATSVWGHDYSGVYYINNQRLPDDGYYFVPTINCFYNGDEDQPHLTTFKTEKDKNSIWRIESVTVGSDTYYRIIHNATGKYLMANDAISALGNSDAHRKRVHLETLSAEALATLDSDPSTDKSLFYLNILDADNKIIAIKSKNVSSGNHSYLNPRGNASADFDFYRAKEGRDIKHTTGIVGFYGNDNSNPPSDQAGSKWKLETATPTCANPVIKYTNSDTNIEISYPISTDTGWTIYYTTDGSDPSDATNGNRTEISATATLTDLTAVTKVRAIAIKEGWENSEESVLIASGKTQLVQSKDCDAFYMVPPIVVSGETVDPIYATTTNIPHAKMGWNFVPAGLYCGIQYYNIINAETNEYLYCNVGNAADNALIMKSIDDISSSEQIDRAKFRLIVQTDGSYKVISKWWAAENPNAYYVNKKNGNNGGNALNLADGSNNTGRWNVIAAPATPKTQFDASFASTTAHYKYNIIQNANSTTYHVLPANTDGGNATANTSIDKQEWFFLAIEDSDPWTQYYQIINGKTGEYLYFNGAAGANNTFFTSSTVEEGNEDRYKFVVVKGANSTYPDAYNIIPKALKNQANQANNSLNRNNTTLRTQNSRTTPASLWNLVLQSPFNCTTPEITWSAGDNGYIITKSEPDAKIYYTLSSEGDLTPSTGILYSTAIPVAGLGVETVTIRAIVARSTDGSDASSVASVIVNRVATPGFSQTEDGRVELTCATNGVSYYYEIGNPGEVNDPIIGSSSTLLYSGPIENAAGKVIKAIAVKGGWINSAVATSEQIVFTCATPVIRKTSATTFTIECNFPTSGVTIRYTKGDGTQAAPTSSTGTVYSGTVTFSESELPFTIKAIAIAANYNNSEVATKELTESLMPDDDGYYEIASTDDFSKFLQMVTSGDADKKYKITTDIELSGNDAISEAFTGELMGVAKADGTFPVISNLDHPIFNTINGGIVKNIMLDKVTIEQSGNVGAIAGVASGYTRIYNCGILPSTSTSTVKSTTTSGEDTGYCGGLVGWLKDDSRVINCFSYANITGGTDVAGIVGHNEAGSTTAVTTVESIDYYSNLRTAVVNCMFYGNITGGSNRYPVYGGAKMVNNTSTGINNYDFYRAEASVGTLTDYNCSWPAKEEYLTKYEFYRNLLNSNRELCGWWVGAPSAPSTMPTTDVQNVPKDATLMAKWVLDTEIAPYPILKKFGKYSSPVNIDADASWRTTANEWEGKKLGTLNVTAKSGSSASDQSLTLVITDMDTLRTDYCYRKVQLPYYNTVFGNPDGETWAAKYGGNYGDNVVIGWKVSTTEGTTGTFVDTGDKAWQDGYNFADRNCTAKDANRVFAQGGYYYVPNGVENITITAQWASAIYLDNIDRYYDRVSVSSFTNDNNILVGSSAISPFAPAGTRPTTLGNGKTVQNGSISSKIPSNGTVYGNAIVLVGNHQYFTGNNNVKGSNNSYGCTIMSADFNCDDEPDYCLEWQLGTKTNRFEICPIRFDFLPVAELGLAMKEDGSTQYYALGCYQPLGHFEVTETALIHFGQFEFGSRRSASPIILNGGIFDQYTKGTTGGKNADGDKMTYVILGGNLKMPSFTPGSHVNATYTYSTRHCAVNVLGGNIDYLYLTGNYNENVTPNQDDPHCYIDGGRFKQVAAAGKEGINGDVTFIINHSKIWEFYGGSTMDQSTGDNYKIVKGSIDVTIDNSIVDKYCGGPKFGDMDYNNSKTITTNATNTIFGVYYGGGNGGTSYVQYGKYDQEQTVPFTISLSGYTEGNYRDETTGYMADYDMEIVNTSTGTNQNRAIYRSYFYAAQFSATNTGSITNNLTNCTVLTNFYGGGNLGGVKGNVTSTLDGTTHVYGSAFGAGFSASVPDVTIHAKDKTAPTVNANTGIITPQSGGSSTTYTWTNESNLNGQTVNGVKYLHTTKSLENLGSVSGNVTLTIKGNSIIDNNVYGGGDASAVVNTITPANASTTVNLQGNALVQGNVYGGGNQGAVSGSTTVNIEE